MPWLKMRKKRNVNASIGGKWRCVCKDERGGMYVWGLLQNQPGIGGTEINAEKKSF
jgi:hypothetical protein